MVESACMQKPEQPAMPDDVHKFLSQNGKKGGAETLRKYGSSHYTKAVTKRWATTKKKQVDKPN